MCVRVAVNRNVALHTQQCVLYIIGRFITHWQQHQKGYDLCLIMKLNSKVVYDQTIKEQKKLPLSNSLVKGSE